MTKPELHYYLTGTETPMFLTEREKVMIDKFLELLNPISDNLEDDCDCSSMDRNGNCRNCGENLV